MKIRLREALAHAACALMATSTGIHAEDIHGVGDWDISAALLLYSETDRVQAVEPVINARKILDTDESINLKLTVDTLTGASASGAVPSTQIQTFTRPSGNGDYQTPGSEVPLDDTFQDGRASLSATWRRPGWWDTKSELGINVSKEYDYQSLGISTSFAKELNSANTTLSTGLSFAKDVIDPVGGRPLAFGTMMPAEQQALRDASDTTKNLVDFIVGVTQVIDANSLVQFNYSLSVADGYQNDPYKVISIVDPDSGRPLFENAFEPTLPTVVYENRPDSRNKHSIFGQYKRLLDTTGDVLDVSYRFLLDDWGITSNTVDFKYRKALSARHFLQPHLRIYQQGAADFYTPFFLSGENPAAGDNAQYASADYRLGDFTAYTIGLEYGQVNTSNSWSVALEYYLQSGDEPTNTPGELSQLEIFPDVEAVIFRILYDF
ncbi:MAG: DUF3570 domain-containing protein [Granulosicoccus sp.]